MLLSKNSVTEQETSKPPVRKGEGRPAINAAVMKQAIRYPSLLAEDWKTLPLSLQTRFVKTIPARRSLIFQGRIHKTRLTKLGSLLSHLCKLIGSPLPLSANCRGSATVIVTEAKHFNGQYWTRIYPSRKQFPQVIQSIKRFDGPTGLEEQISSHIGMALNLKPGEKSLTFSSDHYYIRLSGRRYRLPECLTPGQLTVTHTETGPRRFRYTLSLKHRLFGELVYQTAIFEEVHQCL